MAELLLGIDLGTTRCKALLLDTRGRLLAAGERELPLDSPREDWVEQDTETWIAAATDAIRETVGDRGSEVAVIGLSGQMHGLVLLDHRNRPLRPAIIWADARCHEECRWIEEHLPRHLLVNRLANAPNTGFTAPKLMWVQRHEPHLLRQARVFLLPKDYLRLSMTGSIATEPTDASGTLLFDIAERRWDLETVEALGLPSHLLPPLVESHQVVGRLEATWANRCGLRAGTPVVAGMGDQAAAVLAAGLTPGQTALAALGTAGQLVSTLSHPIIDPRLRIHTLSHAVPGTWLLMGAIQSAGLAFDWFRRLFATATFDELSQEAQRVPPGAEGLLFAPYLTGERSPHMDPRARGSFVGLTLRHHRGHLARAVLEGIILALRDAYEVFLENRVQLSRLVVSGGGRRSALWRNMMRDIFALPVSTSSLEPASPAGAALLAGVGVGLLDVSAVADIAAHHQTAPEYPDEAAVDFYRRLYRLFRQVYPSLKELNQQLGQF